MYRISQFPSNEFYSGDLKDDPGMEKRNAQPWHENKMFPPYAFMDVKNSREQQLSSHSLLNREEAIVAACLIHGLGREYGPLEDLASRIGVITTYRGQ